MQCADGFDGVLQPSRSCHHSADYVPLCEGPIGILIHSRGPSLGPAQMLKPVSLEMPGRCSLLEMELAWVVKAFRIEKLDPMMCCGGRSGGKVESRRATGGR